MTTTTSRRVDVVPMPREADVLELLRARHTRGGNGANGEYALLTHVRDGAAFEAKRTIDAIAVSLWPSRGLVIDGFEVKVSRGDWLRELAKPEKAEDTCRRVDRFWIVAPEGVVHAEELPPMWGYLAVHGGKVDPETREVVGRKLRPVRVAELLHGDKHTAARPIPRGFLVGLLRAAGPTAVPTPASEAEQRDRRRLGDTMQEAYERGRAAERTAVEETIAGLRKEIAGMRDALSVFNQTSGVSLTVPGSWPPRVDPQRAEEVGRALRAVVNGDRIATDATSRLTGMAAELRRAADALDEARRPR